MRKSGFCLGEKNDFLGRQTIFCLREKRLLGVAQDLRPGYKVL